MGFFFESSLIGWIGAIGSVIAAILTLAIYLLTRKKKSLSYEILSENPLISIDDELKGKGKLQMLYEEQPVENVHLLIVKFINSGNVPITKADFETPITLRLEGTSKVLSAEQVEANPDNLVTPLTIEDRLITVKPGLMNGGDFFTVKVLIGQYGGSSAVDARIVGVQSIRQVRKQHQTDRRPLEWRFGLMAALATVSVVASIVWLTVIFRNNTTSTPPDDTKLVQQVQFTPSPPPTPESTPYEKSVSNTAGLRIPDNSPANPYPSEIEISGVSGIITKLAVGIRGATHTNMSDLDILLMGPNGQGVILMSAVGSGKALRRTDIVFDDEAPRSPHFKGGTFDEDQRPQTISPILKSGTYRPTNYKTDEDYEFPDVSLTEFSDKLSVFKGTVPNGKWKLYVIDRAEGDVGTIGGGWELTMNIEPSPPHP